MSIFDKHRDTLEVHGVRIRLWGVDAPEGRQVCDDAQGRAYACGRLSANRLAAQAPRRR